MAAVRKAYATADGRRVHYRVCGAGPAIVMLHDSPRSSRLHLETMAALADQFTVYALDTAGYGNSAPLGTDDPTIEDFAQALNGVLLALGLDRAPLYATHTSAKIALAMAARGGAMPRLVLDGLSLPETLASPDFVAAYMRPFRIDDSGAYLAAEWSRTRDMLRWFPWFTPTPSARMIMAPPSPEWMADYGVDLFSAGPHYADAYAAAMRWDPMPALLAVKVPTLVAARRDDVLFGFLDRVPVNANPALTVERLGTDRAEWLGWLRKTLGQAVSSETAPAAAQQPSAEAGYLDLAHGQLHWERTGSGDTVLALSAPTTLQARAWATALSPHHAVLVPDLPGFGESDPIQPARNRALAIVDALAHLIEAEASGPVTVLGIGVAAPLAARLAARHPQHVARLVIDGAPPLDPARAAQFGKDLTPAIAFDAHAGSHLHRIWHLLRDAEVQWPWHDASAAATRKLPPLLSGEELHRALIGVLKQPDHWGDAAQAAVAQSGRALWAEVTAPTLVFTYEDPAYAEATTIAGLVPHGRAIPRPDRLDDALPLLMQQGA